MDSRYNEKNNPKLGSRCSGTTTRTQWINVSFSSHLTYFFQNQNYRFNEGSDEILIKILHSFLNRSINMIMDSCDNGKSACSGFFFFFYRRVIFFFLLTHTHTHTHTHTYIYIYIYIYIYACVCARVCVHMCVQAYVCVYAHNRVYVRARMYICVRTRVHVCVCVCVGWQFWNGSRKTKSSFQSGKPNFNDQILHHNIRHCQRNRNINCLHQQTDRPFFFFFWLMIIPI